jgi:hypothetical protein
MAKVQKKKDRTKSPEEKLDHKLTGKFEDLSQEDKLQVLQGQYKIAAGATPDYDQLRVEMDEFDADLPSDPDVTDFSTINALYATCQSYLSRVTTIEILAVSNCSNWKKLCHDTKILIKELEWDWEEQEADILLTDEVKDLKNAQMQQAAVRKKLPKLYKKLKKMHSNLSRFQSILSKAEAFREIAEIKKKDLTSILMNLTRQVKALSLELQATGYGKES